MKKFAAFLLIAIFAFTLVACGGPATGDDNGNGDEGYANVLEKIKGEGKMVLGVSPDYAPCEFVDPTKDGPDKYVGSDIEFAKYIAEKLGVELVIEAMDFDSIQAAVQTGKVDIGISGFSWMADRAEAVYLSDTYNMNDFGQGLLVLDGQQGDYASAEDFEGKTVAAQNASLQYTLCEEQLPESVTIMPVTNINDAVMMLQTGKVDAVAVSGENGLSIINANPGLAFCDFEFHIEDEGYVCMIQKGQDEFLEAVNEIIAEVVELGLYNQWLLDAQALQQELGLE